MPASPPLSSRRDQIKARIRATSPQHMPGYRLRLSLIGVILLLSQLGLLVRLFWLQVREAPWLSTKAEQQQRGQIAQRFGRYPIVDRQNNILAKDQRTFDLYAHPVQFDVPAAEIAQAVAPILQRPVDELQQLFKQGPTGIPVASDLPQDSVDALQALYLNGLELTSQWRRLYPQREITAGIVGFADVDHQGQAGIEYSQQKLLVAKVPPWKVSWDGQGRVLPDRFPVRMLNATDLTLKLTLDIRLQRSARVALRRQLQKFQARRGTVIVMDIHDGSLLALASEPSFDPQQYYQADTSLFKNWAVSDLYEPGSTFKPINVAIALETGAIKADSTFYDQGQITVGGWPINNNDRTGRGPISVTQVLEYSSNVGMVRMMEQVQRATYYDFLKKIGIGSLTGTDLPFESSGQFKPRRQFIDYPIEPATAAFGQGFSVTPLQMAQLHGAIANGGTLVTPHVIRGLYNRSDRRVKGLDLIKPRQIWSKKTAADVRSMMGSVVANGTGKPAQIPGYRLGGKTGTAQKASGGIYGNARITSFVASFPLDSPQYVVLAVVDEPQGGNAFGSTVAAPIVKSVLETLISVEAIPPSHPEELKPKSKPTPVH